MHCEQAVDVPSYCHGWFLGNVFLRSVTVQRLNFVTLALAISGIHLQCGAKFGRGHQRRHTGGLDTCLSLHTAMVCG